MNEEIIGHSLGECGDSEEKKKTPSPNGFILKFMCDSSQHCFGSPLHQNDLSLNFTCNSHQVRGFIATSKSLSFHTSPLNILLNAPSHWCSFIHSSTSVRHSGWHTSDWWTVSSPVQAATERSSPTHLDFKEKCTILQLFLFCSAGCSYLYKNAVDPLE